MTKNCKICKNTDGSVVKKRCFRVPAQSQRNYVGKKGSLQPQRRLLWLQRIYGKVPENIPKELWICEDHFVTGAPSKLSEVNHEDWAPSLKLHQSVLSVPDALQIDQNEINQHGLASGSRNDEPEENPFPSDQIPFWLGQYEHDDISSMGNQLIDVCGEIETADMSRYQVPASDIGSSQDESDPNAMHFSSEHDSESEEDEVFFDACSELSVATQTVKNWEDLATQTDKRSETFGTQTDKSKYRTMGCQTELPMFEIDTIEEQLRDAQCRLNALEISEDWYKDDEVTQYYTGLPNYCVLMAIFKVVAPYISYSSRSTLTKFQQYALTLMKLRLNLYFTDLGHRFNVSSVTAERIFMNVIEVLYCRTKRNVFWPERPISKSTMPTEFLESFGDSIPVIIDCFEIHCERASNLMAKAQQHQTVKYLIGVLPQGLVWFVSKGYGGRRSNKYITENSGFLNHLNPGDVVMADTGVLFEDSVGFQMAKVVMPAFTKGLDHLNPNDVKDTRKIANVRIHVERVVSNLRQKYRILSNEVPIRLPAYKENNIGMDEIVMVCCALMNFTPAIVPLDPLD